MGTDERWLTETIPLPRRFLRAKSPPVGVLPAADEDGFLGGAFEFDAAGLDGGIVLEGAVNDAAVVGVHRLEFHGVPEAADLVGGGVRLFTRTSRAWAR